MPWTLADIRRKVRLVTGRLSSTDMTDARMNDYINQYTQYTLPADVKLERTHTYYQFLTEANVEQYVFPNSTYTNVEPKLYLNERPLLWYQDPNVFFQQNPQPVQKSTPWSGNGMTVLFNTTAQSPPLAPNSIIITDNTETFTDNGVGILSSNLGGVGSVNYTTGAISVTFNTAPANGQDIFLTYIYYRPNLPTAVMLYNNVFWFYPVPDTVYRCRIKAYSNVLVESEAGVAQSTFILATDRPQLEEWGEAIAYGAAKKIFADNGETERVAEVTALYREQVDVILTRTCQNLLNMRAMPMF